MDENEKVINVNNARAKMRTKVQGHLRNRKRNINEVYLKRGQQVNGFKTGVACKL